MLHFVRDMTTPPKEGRAHPGLPCMDEQRRCQLVSRKRVIAVVLMLLLTRILVAIVSDAQPVAVTPARPVTPGLDAELNTLFKRTTRSPTLTVERDGGSRRQTRLDDDDEPIAAVVGEADEKPLPAAARSHPHPKDFSRTSRRPSKADARAGAGAGKAADQPQQQAFQRRPELEAALERIINLLPGEMYMRDLLRPVDGTGKERLREMGLRTRSYRDFFQAWEDLHFETDREGVTYIRGDVVQYLTHLAHAADADADEPPTGLLATMSAGQLIRAYETYRYFLAKFGQLLFAYTAPFFPDHMSLHLQFKTADRGIVLTAGDDQAHYLLTSIHSFRKLGCTLPVEVMYLGDSDLSEDFRAELEAIDGVVTRDVSQMVNDEGWTLAGWAIKPFAIMFSSFREVIFIDADSLFFTNPAKLFDDPAYRKTGALFFRDRLMMPESHKRWVQQVLPKPFSAQVKQNRFWTGESAHMQESGVVVVDKWKHFLAMLLVTRMNGPDRDGDEDNGKIGVYDMVYGDKETFWLGWELSGDFKYAFHQGDAGTMGVINETYFAAGDAQPHHDDDDDDDEAERKHDHDHDHDHEHGDGEGDEDGDKPDREAGGRGKDDAEDRRDVAPSGVAENYTICSPQLLHLDLDGRPLWFNGWVLDSKFVDKSHKHYASFDAYVVEPHGWEGSEDAWQLQEDNRCCLSTHARLKFSFTEAEKATLDMIVERAREVEATVLS